MVALEKLEIKLPFDPAILLQKNGKQSLKKISVYPCS